MQDELTDAVREENASSTKLGVGLNTSMQFGNARIFTAQTTTTANYNLDTSQKQAREQTHKGLRQQTEKLTSEIRQSFKSVFRTVTETSDTTSRRYVIQNTTNSLVNYELRRKMRQVGVQVQDYGTQLCWQTYVDKPGKELGVAMLVHIAEPEDLSRFQDPEQIPDPEPEIRGATVTLNNEWPWDDDKSNSKGPGFVPFVGRLTLTPAKSGFIYSRAEVIRVDGHNWDFRAHPSSPEDVSYSDQHFSVGPADWESIPTGEGNQTEVSVKTISVGVQIESSLRDDHPKFTLQVTPVYRPSRKLLKDIHDQNAAKLANAKEEKARAHQEALFKAAAERIKAASSIQPRKFEDLREEERTVVYRSLIRQLLAGIGISPSDARLHHLFAELVQGMFDVPSMLYFVAPEWWMPRAIPPHKTPQDVGLTAKGDRSATPGVPPDQAIVSWGGAGGARPDNYYITGDSAPVRIGSSLGWLIQLDGDNLRNAFLNAPWVKAVVPIRPDAEWRALDWLGSVEGNDGLGESYVAADDSEKQAMIAELKAYPWKAGDPLGPYYSTLAPGGLTILDAIRYLIVRVRQKHAHSRETIPDSIDPKVGYLPVDKVFEHGFDPLAGGFRLDKAPVEFDVFDQWLEILPTDQVVAVEVQYDPKTGRQV
jgi:hypothetical protein